MSANGAILVRNVLNSLASIHETLKGVDRSNAAEILEELEYAREELETLMDRAIDKAHENAKGE